MAFSVVFSHLFIAFLLGGRASGTRQSRHPSPSSQGQASEVAQRADRNLQSDGRPPIPQCSGEHSLAVRRSMQQDVSQHAVSPYLLTNQDPVACLSCRNPIVDWWQAVCRGDTQSLSEDLKPQFCPPETQRSVRHHFSSKGGLYEGLVLWQPCDLWPLLRGRTLWVGGDSHSQDFYRSLRCVMHQFHDYDFQGPYQDLLDVPVHWTESKSPNLEVGPDDKPALASCEPLVEGTRLCQFRANWGHTFVDHAIPWLEKLAKPGDILVANFGAWHGRQNWVGDDYGELVGKLAQQVRERMPQLQLVWKDSAPTHFDNHLGAYNDLQPPFECVPLKMSVQHDGSVKGYSEAETLLEQGGALNVAARKALAGFGVPMMASFNATAELWEAHRGIPGKTYECNHYCFPGVPAVWVYYLYKTLADNASSSQ